MSNVIDYKIVKTLLEFDLGKLIKNSIKEGWEPIGGVCIYKEYQYQSMIKKEENK